MLNNEIVRDEIFADLSEIGKTMGICVVDVIKTVHANEVNVAITIQSNSGETGIDDCERFHKAVQPRLELKFGRDVLSMEVSTPGLQRTFRDCHEFSCFTGKQVRLYSLELSSWLNGMIKNTDSDSVVLSDVTVEDGNVKHEEYKIDYKNIQKAKLDFNFAAVKETKNVKSKRSN